MKGKKCLDHLSRSRVFSAFLLLLLSLLFSLFPVNKASALTYTNSIVYKEKMSSGNWNIYYRHGAKTNPLESYTGLQLNIQRKGNDPNTYPDDPYYIKYLCTVNSHQFTKDDIVNFKISTRITESPDVVGAITDFYTPGDFTIETISIDYTYDTPLIDGRNGIFSSSGVSYPYSYSVDYYPEQYVVWDIILRVDRDGNFPVCLGRNDSNARYLYTLPKMHYSTGLLNYSYTFQFSPANFVYIYNYDTSSQDMNEKDDQDRDNLENQKTESQDSSDESQEDAENTGTTLLAAFSSFVTAITSASPSNCNLLMNMGNLNLGNVDLCQLSLPPEFQAIASIFMILFCVPLSIATARKVINLFRSFQS